MSPNHIYNQRKAIPLFLIILMMDNNIVFGETVIISICFLGYIQAHAERHLQQSSAQTK